MHAACARWRRSELRLDKMYSKVHNCSGRNNLQAFCSKGEIASVQIGDYGNEEADRDKSQLRLLDSTSADFAIFVLHHKAATLFRSTAM